MVFLTDREYCTSTSLKPPRIHYITLPCTRLCSTSSIMLPRGRREGGLTIMYFAQFGSSSKDCLRGEHHTYIAAACRRL